ncbi:hypothetical protein C8Q77DRAFT_524545 [Trametes polyzona]|nr:hypothetical protein C8Q77DRAFT_524545 [Trametes polyzona]
MSPPPCAMRVPKRQVCMYVRTLWPSGNHLRADGRKKRKRRFRAQLTFRLSSCSNAAQRDTPREPVLGLATSTQPAGIWRPFTLRWGQKPRVSVLSQPEGLVRHPSGRTEQHEPGAWLCGRVLLLLLSHNLRSPSARTYLREMCASCALRRGGVSLRRVFAMSPGGHRQDNARGRRTGTSAAGPGTRRRTILMLCTRSRLSRL